MSFTTDKTSSGLTARQHLGLDDNAGRNNPRSHNTEHPLPSHAAYVSNSNRSACCEDTRRKLELNVSTHESDLGSNGIPSIPPAATHRPTYDSSQGYRPEPNPTQILSQLQRMLEDKDGEDKTSSPTTHSSQVHPERTPPSLDREAWLATRPTIADLITPRARPPRPPPPPIPPPKTYNALTEFCLRHNTLCCWPCSDARDKLPALEVFLNQIVNSNKPRYQELELLDENGKLPERQVWMSSCPVMVCDVCCACLKPWRWGEGCWWAHWWVWVKVEGDGDGEGGNGRVGALMPGGGGVWDYKD